MASLMKVWGLGDGSNFPKPLWVESFDVDVEPLWKESILKKDGGVIINGAFGGRIVLTPNRDMAMRFDTNADAMVAWNTKSVARPRRPDGRPNKPLTVLSVEIERA